MKLYIGCKIVEAEPQVKDGMEGYKVVYEDGYTSWSPKAAFDKSYIEISRQDCEQVLAKAQAAIKGE